MLLHNFSPDIIKSTLSRSVYLDPSSAQVSKYFVYMITMAVTDRMIAYIGMDVSARANRCIKLDMVAQVR